MERLWRWLCDERWCGDGANGDSGIGSMPKPSGARNGDAADVEIETEGECPGWNL